MGIVGMYVLFTYIVIVRTMCRDETACVAEVSLAIDFGARFPFVLADHGHCLIFTAYINGLGP